MERPSTVGWQVISPDVPCTVVDDPCFVNTVASLLPQMLGLYKYKLVKRRVADDVSALLLLDIAVYNSPLSP